MSDLWNWRIEYHTAVPSFISDARELPWPAVCMKVRSIPSLQSSKKNLAPKLS